MICGKNFQYDEKLKPEEIISLMGIYREEWKYRDNAFMSTFFKFSFLSLFITFFPYLINRIGIDSNSPLLVKIHPIIFSVFGILFSLFGFFYSYNEAKRIEFLDDAYKRLMKQLPQTAQVEIIKDDINNNKNKIKNFQSIRLNSILYCAYLIPIGLAVLNIVLIIL